MQDKILLLPILIPIAAAILAFAASFTRIRWLKEFISLIAAAINLFIAISLFKTNASYSAPWGGFGFEFLLRCYHFSAFIVAATACFGFLITLYSCIFMHNKKFSNQFYLYLLVSIAFVNGAVLADNLVLMLFFWEGLLLTLFGFIAIGKKDAFMTATKAFIITGVCDLCLMVGIALTGYLAGTLTISQISLSAGGAAGLAFIFLVIGAIGKAGSMPFHSWIPDAGIDAPLPFMAIMPAALEKLLGIYFLARISLDMFKLEPNSWASMTLMIVGAITILLAVMMALIQKDYKRLLSYHAISQVGYMILGIGTLVPAGIVGGLFHMLNNTMYKSCLFLTGGSVEKEAGTTNLEKLGGLGARMPITFACFIIAAVSISGVPPFNGFFSKELVYDGALERGKVFYIAALLGSFLTAASFLKLGHSAFLGKLNKEHKDVKEAPIQMLIPMIIIAASCVLFGVWNALPIDNLIQPIIGEHRLEGHSFSGLPKDAVLVALTVVVLIAALLNHIYGVKRMGSGIKAVDHIHHAPILADIYDRAEKRYFDPYNIGLHIVKAISDVAWLCDKTIDWVYNVFTVKVTFAFSGAVRRMHNGKYNTYIAWSLVGAVAVILFLMRS